LSKNLIEVANTLSNYLHGFLAKLKRFAGENGMRIIGGFTFNDFCQRCQNVTGHGIAASDSTVVGICSGCELRRLLTELRQIFYPKTTLWVTRFKVNNLDNVVAGRLLDSILEISE
jgi:hypothetical protein